MLLGSPSGQACSAPAPATPHAVLSSAPFLQLFQCLLHMRALPLQLQGCITNATNMLKEYL